MRSSLADVARRVEAAERFVLSPHVVMTITGLCDPAVVERSRPHLFFPAALTWIEWAGEVPWRAGEARLGVLFVGPSDEVPRTGEMVFFLPAVAASAVPYIPVAGWCDLSQAGPIWRPRVPDGPALASIDIALAGAWIGAALALINTPRLADVRRYDHQALNKSRGKKGLPPLLSWKEVGLTVDRGDLGISRNGLETGERAHHHVRAHMRLKRGKVEIVRPHWRGNPEFGVLRHRYAVRRAEDEGSEWKGGMLPLPRIIKDGQS